MISFVRGIIPLPLPLPLPLLLLALASAGCSFKIVRPPPARSEWPVNVTSHDSELGCTSTPAPPIVDGLFFATGATLAYVERNSGTPSLAIGIGLASVPFLISAIYGAINVSACRGYQARFRPSAGP